MNPPDDTQWAPLQAEADNAWDLTGENTLTNPGKADIIVAVLDTGCNIAHQDITASSIWKNPDEQVGKKYPGHYPGRQNIDDDQDGGIDFNDPDIVHFDSHGDGTELGGTNGIAEGFWDESLIPPGWNKPPGFDDDLREYEIMQNDNDEDGYVNDIYGFDFQNSLPYVLLSDITDPGYDGIYHGTHCAGILSALINNNQIGIAGIAQVKLMILRILPDHSTDPSPSDAWEKAAHYAIDKGADVISCSVGDPDPIQPIPTYLDEVMDYARAKGVIWVNAAGNYDPNDPIIARRVPDVRYPANSGEVISVGASNREGSVQNEYRAWYSCFGPQNQIDLLAPGGTGNWVDEDDVISTYGPDSDDYEYLHGTSMATPLVAGIVGLLLSYHQDVTVERIEQILMATTTDITAAVGVHLDDEADFGRDIETGYGEVDAQRALGIANYMKNCWSPELKLFHDAYGFSEDGQPSIAVDSEGYSHGVWIDNGPMHPEVVYASINPAGQFWCTPKSIENAATKNWGSKSPDIYVDSADMIHIGWLEHIAANQDDVYYILLNTAGVPQCAPTKVTLSQTPKAFTNIFTNKNNLPTIIYAEDTGVANTRWDISSVSKDFLGWLAPIALVNTVADETHPSADIGEDINGNNFIYCAYQTWDAQDWEIWMWSDNPNQHTWQLTNDQLDDIEPNVAVSYLTLEVYIVWIHSDIIELDAINGANGNIPFYYGYPTDPFIMVGTAAVPGDLQSPQVSVSQISKSHGRPDALSLAQVNVVWRRHIQNQWYLMLSELTSDGRIITPELEKSLTTCSKDDPHAITASQIRSRTRSYWLDSDGNFRMVLIKATGGPGGGGNGRGQYPPGGGGIVVNELWFLSTREKFETPTHIGSNNRPQADPYIDIDSDNSLHLTYLEPPAGGGTIANRVMYAYWANGARPPAAPTKLISVSPAGSVCSQPKVVGTRSATGAPEATVVYYIDTQNGLPLRQIWIATINSGTGQIIRNCRIGCTQFPDLGKAGIVVINDKFRRQIGVAWSENEPGRMNDIHFGIVDYENICIQMQTNAIVEGSPQDEINPDFDVDTDGRYWLVYERPSTKDIYYNGIINSNGIYIKLWPQDKKVDDRLQQDDSMNPAIRIDRPINRRSDNHQVLTDTSTKTNRFTHIVYCRTTPDNHYVLTYSKWDLNGNILVAEKDITSFLITRNIYYSDEPIRGRIVLDANNQVSIVYCAKMHHGNNWPILNNKYAIFFTKLDNNGEILTAETQISDDRLRDSKSPEACYDKRIDKDNGINIVWQYDSINGKEIRYSRNNVMSR
jgi:subtilisin family serine protease